MTTHETPPYLSVVAASRNDDHGGDMLNRLAVFAHALAGQSSRFRLPVELVLVDWNPPPDRPLLADAIGWPAETRWFSTRIVVVPPRLHRAHALGDRLPFLQMPAKNVGIRLSRSPFVLATNVDVLLSDHLMQALARRRLAAGRFYRADRFDVDVALDPADPVELQLAACARSVIRMCRWYGTEDCRTGELFPVYSRLSRALPHSLARWAKIPAYGFPFIARAGARRARRGALLASRAARSPRRALALALRRAHAVPATVLPSHRRLLETLALYTEQARMEWMRQRAIVPLHTNACGDFTLMSRADWHRLRGYPELPSFSMHLDSILLYEAHYAGLRQTRLPGQVFHLEHGEGFKPEDHDALYEGLTAAGIPHVSNTQLTDMIIAMFNRRGPVTPANADDWGLWDEDLPVQHVGRGAVAA